MYFGWYGWTNTTGLFLAGVILALPLILTKFPNARDFGEKLKTYSIYIGAVIAIGGVLGLLFGWLFHLGWMACMPLLQTLVLITSLLGIVAGFLLLMNLLRTRKELPQEKLEAINAKLAAYQIPIGLACMSMSVFYLFYGLVLFNVSFSMARCLVGI
jgi:hypothetical protein